MTERPPKEPVFLSTGAANRIRILAGDFLNFTSTVVYYPLLATVGSAAYLGDKALGTESFDRFIVAVERFDHGKESVIDGGTP